LTPPAFFLFDTFMKYAIVIPDGAADEPQESLGGRTPLQAANTPNMDRVARAGFVGLTDNVPRPLTPASDVATLSLFGYDPLAVYTGRAPLECAARGIGLGPHDWAVRCNLVTVEGGVLRDFTAGHITSEEGLQLVEALQAALGGRHAGLGEAEFHSGVSYRNLLLVRGNPQLRPAFGPDTRTQPPHDIPDQPVAAHLPQGPGADLLRRLMEHSAEVLADHPVNRARRAAGQRPATQAWLWGQGRAPRLRPFAERFGKRGAIVSAVDLVRGVGVLIGWTRIDVPGATGYLDTDYAAKGRHAADALAGHDLVCVHVEAPDEASHEGRTLEKVQALEEIDRHVVGPLLAALPGYGGWRILIAPDHRTTLRTRAHAYGPVPFAMAGTGFAAAGRAAYDEAEAAAGGPVVGKGFELMPRFLGEIEEFS
jgi:2,3-bisphosphoglycerate-independent phosphoglycerate mutase